MSCGPVKFGVLGVPARLRVARRLATGVFRLPLLFACRACVRRGLTQTRHINAVML